MSLLRDSRDRPFLMLLLQGSLLLPAGMIVFAAHRESNFAFWVATLLFFATYFGHLERFITMYHDLNHSTLFARRFGWLNGYVNGVFGPLYGVWPGTYFGHHVLMHHPCENLADDVSSTLPYRRDSASSFIRYYLRFFGSVPATARFLAGRYPGRYAARMLAGEAATVAVFGVLAWADVAAAIVVVAAPLLVTRSLLIIGNWAEHAFVDPAAPDDPLRNTTDCIGSSVNGRAFNVGYHSVHHMWPTAHWTTLSERFDPERWGRADAVVLRDLNYPQVWWLLMTRQYGALAERFVQLPGAPTRTRAEVVDLLRHRVQPIRVA